MDKLIAFIEILHKNLNNKMNVKQIRHYLELIESRIDDWENALDDDMPEIGEDIEAIIDDLHELAVNK